MQIAKALVEAGVLAGQPLTEELRQKLDTIISFEPKGDWRTTKPHLEVVLLNSTFYVYDFVGFLASTKSIEGLILLFMLNEEGPARNVIFPEETESETSAPSALDRDFSELRARAQRIKESAIERQAKGPRGAPGSGLEHGITENDGPVRTMGLSDGIPRIEGS